MPVTLEEVYVVGLDAVSVQLADMHDLLLGISFGNMVHCGVQLGVAIILVLAVMFRD